MFDNLFGQTNVKKRLSFYKRAFDATKECPFLFFTGAKGTGKTEFAKAFASGLYDGDKQRECLELNCAMINNATTFFETYYFNHIMDKNITILFDEAHNLPKDLSQIFLTVFNTEKTTTKQIMWEDTFYDFDFKRQTFMFATTESNQIFGPLKDRFTPISFAPYTYEELGNIFKANCKCTFEENALIELSKISRGNARNCILKSIDVDLFCAAENIKVFREMHLDHFFSELGILPLGLTETEFEILFHLDEDGPQSLQNLAAKTGHSRASIQWEHEAYLMKKSLMDIDGKRKITKLGSQLVKSI